MVSLWTYWRRGSRPAQGFDAAGGSMSYATELTRRTPTAPLTSQGADTGTLRIDLSWRMHSSDLDMARPSRWRQPLQLFKPAEIQSHTQGLATVDFDLACLYELADGNKGVVQPLGGLFGDFSEPPYVKLSGDDRFGTASGETLYVNLDHKDAFKRLLVFVYLYDSVPAFDRANVVVTLVTSDGRHIDVALTDPAPQARSCAVVMIEHHKGELVARREVKYVYGFQSEIDRLYGWGMSWGRGFKPSRSRA